jgi:hypothetical protein
VPIGITFGALRLIPEHPQAPAPYFVRAQTAWPGDPPVHAVT